MVKKLLLTIEDKEPSPEIANKRLPLLQTIVGKKLLSSKKDSRLLLEIINKILVLVINDKKLLSVTIDKGTSILVEKVTSCVSLALFLPFFIF